MLAIIKRLLVMSGDLRGRVQLSILTSFLDAMAAMLPLGAVFLVLDSCWNGLPQAAWLTLRFGARCYCSSSERRFCVSCSST